MPAKEAKARIKINKLLEEAGWRFFDDEAGPANIVLEPHVKTTQTQISELGENFEETKSGFVDFLLLDEKGFPFMVLESKAVHAIQRAMKDGKNRFLFEMATGPGKTLTAAAIIKPFPRTGNATRVLFLVDRLELESQADKVKKALPESRVGAFVITATKNKTGAQLAEMIAVAWPKIQRTIERNRRPFVAKIMGDGSVDLHE